MYCQPALPLPAGCRYYHNDVTGETKWEVPEHLAWSEVPLENQEL
jgi:hypothetical protein